jgi:hypothetical protein
VRRLGWRTVERLVYLGQERTVMEYALGAPRAPDSD